MLEPTKQQQLHAALAGWGENRLHAIRSKVASALENTPDLEGREALRQALIQLETKFKSKVEAIPNLESSIASIPNLELQEEIREANLQFVLAMRMLEDRVLNGDDESRPKRYELFRKIRSTYDENHGRAEQNESAIWLNQWIVAHFDAIEQSLLPQVNENAAILALDFTLNEPLPGEAGFPRCWEILAYLLPREARNRIYEPARAELLEDYLLSRSCRRGWWSRLAVNGVFLVRTLFLASVCVHVLFASRFVQFWLWILRFLLR